MRRIDFTIGAPWKKIIAFALPLLLSSILQQLYNTVAGIIVGRGVSDAGLAAVGLAGPYLNVLTSFFMGVAMGGNVLMAQYFGAKDEIGCRRTTHTAIVLALIAGLALTGIGIAITPMILKWTNAPEDVYPMALTYMRILFTGVVFQMMYNMLASFLRGTGDSRTQLYILAVTSVLNAGLCWIFVMYFEWGIAGAAMATVISQAVSVLIIFFCLQRSPWTRISLSELKVHGEYAKELLRIGLPTALQQVAMSMAGMVVMGFVSDYGTKSIAGYSTGNMMDMYVTMPISSLNMSVTPFAAQNVGAGRMDRVHQAAKQVAFINLCLTAVLGTIVIVFSESLIGMFSSDPVTIAAGVTMLRIIIPSNMLNSITQPLSGVIRGSGDPITPMFNTIMMVVIVRIPIIIIFNRIFNRIEVIYFSQVAAQIYGLTHILIVYFKGKWKKKALATIEARQSNAVAGEKA